MKRHIDRLFERFVEIANAAAGIVFVLFFNFSTVALNRVYTRQP
jgi:hypothetical protein